jgi:hypothetical protein
MLEQLEQPGQTKNTEQLDHGLEVECAGVLIDRSALRATVREDVVQFVLW